MPNLDVRFKAKASGVSLWQIAAKMEISENTLYRKLRKEMTQKEKEEFFKIIRQIAKEQKQAGSIFAKGEK